MTVRPLSGEAVGQSRASRWDRLSLSRRLVGVLLVLLLISYGAVAGATALIMRRSLLQRLDQQLNAAGDRYSVSLEHGDGDADDKNFDGVLGQSTGTLGARMIGGSVTAIGVVGRPGDVPQADRAIVAALPMSGAARTVSLPSLGEYRVVVRAGNDGDLLVTGLPEHSVDETIKQLAVVEAAVLALAVALTGLAAVVCVRLSLRPLARLTRTAHRVAELPLASGEVALVERVDNPAPGTEVGQVSEAFNHMLEHVESALAARHDSEDRLRSFIADASHELRTPVAVIRSHAEYAQRADPELDSTTEQALQRITAESDRMGRLVEELLLLARLDSGRPLADDEVDLTRLAIDAVTDAQVAGPDHRWQLDLPEEPVLLRGDDHRLHQAVANLLANARTHTPAGTTVTVAVGPAPDPQQAEIRILDDGPGIDSALLPRVFDRFSHSDSAPRDDASANTGLGLSIVAAIVRAHRGTITVTSRPGETEFVLRLPAS